MASLMLSTGAMSAALLGPPTTSPLSGPLVRASSSTRPNPLAAVATDTEVTASGCGSTYNISSSGYGGGCNTERSRGFGFVTFVNQKSVRDAIKGMNSQNLDYRSITVNEAQFLSGCGDRYGGHRKGW
ncbi:hypothetical protein CRG98_028244 [Punica granatum]|uniref:RRM domain-containing protein n=1 Tax=Punica granatum TaxID=22663 RepID=A0A2I0J5P7_PUNGR|nr:hypothetical protein CRG98_028244 [Punica granatum]